MSASEATISLATQALDEMIKRIRTFEKPSTAKTYARGFYLALMTCFGTTITAVTVYEVVTEINFLSYI